MTGWLIVAAILLAGYLTARSRGWHMHSDPAWTQEGVWGYHQCRRCGARRVVHLAYNLHGPVEYGWPLAVNAHNQPVRMSAWEPRPEGGWPIEAKPPASAYDELRRSIRPPKGRGGGSW